MFARERTLVSRQEITRVDCCEVKCPIVVVVMVVMAMVVVVTTSFQLSVVVELTPGWTNRRKEKCV